MNIHIFTLFPILLFAFFALTSPTHAADVPVGTGFLLNWADNNPASAGVTGYTVYEQTAAGPLLAERSVGTAKQVRITPRPLGTHTYVVTATGIGGESSPSLPVVVNVVPVVVPPTPTVPGLVQGLSGVMANGNLTLTWSARPAGENVTSYSVIETRPGVPSTITTVNATSLSILNLSQGTHNYQVSAANATGEGPRSAVYTVNITTPQDVPVAPVDFRFEALPGVAR